MKEPQSLTRAKLLCHPQENNVNDATMATLPRRLEKGQNGCSLNKSVLTFLKKKTEITLNQRNEQQD